jgi:hypothetical protein
MIGLHCLLVLRWKKRRIVMAVHVCYYVLSTCYMFVVGSVGKRKRKKALINLPSSSVPPNPASHISHYYIYLFDETYNTFVVD